MKRSINICKLIILVIVIGFVFLLPLCACQRKTSTTKETITTTEKTTTKEYKLEIPCEVEQASIITEYIFQKENDSVKWILKDESGQIYEGYNITIYDRNRLWKDEEGLHLDLTFDDYKYVLSII